MVTNRSSSVSFLLTHNLIFIFLGMHLTACTTPNITQQEQVVHVVLIWLKESGNEQHIVQIIDTTKRLKEIPEIKQLRVGKSIPSNRKIVDHSFDVGIYMTFASLDDMQHYLNHPKHKHAVKTVIKPLASKLIVFDFTDQSH